VGVQVLLKANAREGDSICAVPQDLTEAAMKTNGEMHQTFDGRHSAEPLAWFDC
jgi:hypothetical protein